MYKNNYCYLSKNDICDIKKDASELDLPEFVKKIIEVTEKVEFVKNGINYSSNDALALLCEKFNNEFLKIPNIYFEQKKHRLIFYVKYIDDKGETNLKEYFVDGYWESEEGKILIEVEGGRCVTCYQYLNDLKKAKEINRKDDSTDVEYHFNYLVIYTQNIHYSRKKEKLNCKDNYNKVKKEYIISQRTGNLFNDNFKGILIVGYGD